MTRTISQKVLLCLAFDLRESIAALRVFACEYLTRAVRDFGELATPYNLCMDWLPRVTTLHNLA
jgi:hypothetical protein